MLWIVFAQFAFSPHLHAQTSDTINTLIVANSEKIPLEGQIVIDPLNPVYPVYNRDSNNNGILDPFFLIGPGDPEGFLYLG